MPEIWRSEGGAPDYATLDNEEMLAGAKIEYRDHASAYADSANVFVPYYRQSGMRYAGEAIKKTGSFDNALMGPPYEDLTAALDYYFENCNGGRPFIIAGHSQGSAMTLLLLKKYFREHPDYYERMVAAYPIGYSVTDEYLEANPHLKFAAGECDTGVIVSWNTEGPGNCESLPHDDSPSVPQGECRPNAFPPSASRGPSLRLGWQGGPSTAIDQSFPNAEYMACAAKGAATEVQPEAFSGFRHPCTGGSQNVIPSIPTQAPRYIVRWQKMVSR